MLEITALPLSPDVDVGVSMGMGVEEKEVEAVDSGVLATKGVGVIIGGGVMDEVSTEHDPIVSP